jgi:membrane fusion protein, heavy metal efflux system
LCASGAPPKQRPLAVDVRRRRSDLKRKAETVMNRIVAKLSHAPRRLMVGIAACLVVALAPPDLSARELPVSPEQIKQFDIKLAEVRQATKSLVATLPATIVPPANSRIAVTAPFAGTVLQLHGLPGQEVHKGEVLAVLASRDLSEAVVRLKQAEAELQVAEAVARRQRELFSKNLITSGKLAEADAQVEKVRALTSESQRLFKIGNIQINADGTYALTAPRDGRIVEMRATPGAALQAMDAAAVIDTSRQLWLQAQLPGHMVGKVLVGDRIDLPDGEVGKVISVGITLDPMTRSTTLLAEIPLSAKHIAGQTTTITLVKPANGKELEISADAITWIGGAPYVFVRTKTGFLPTPVSIKGRTADIATIEADLRPGQQLAVNGLSQLEKMMTGD